MLSFLIQNNYSSSYLILYLYFILLLSFSFFLQRYPKLYKFHILQTEDTRFPPLYYY